MRQGQEVEISSPSTSCLHCNSICTGYGHVLTDIWPLVDHGDKAETQGKGELRSHVSLSSLMRLV